MAVEVEEYEWWEPIIWEPEIEFIVLPPEYRDYSSAQVKAIMKTEEAKPFRSFEAFIFAMLEQGVTEYDIWRRTYP